MVMCMEDIKRRFGKQLKQLRTQQGLTQQQLAERADVSISFLGNIERGAKSPTIDTMQKLSHALHVPLVTLVGFETEEEDTTCKRTQMCEILRECADKIEQLYEK